MAEITSLAIVNRACARIGMAPLQSLDDETPGGLAAAMQFESLLDLCLGLTPWTWARETKELNRVTSPRTNTGYAFEFVIPQGFRQQPARLLRSTANDDVLTAYEIEGDRLFCDDTQVFAQMIVRGHPEKWSGPFRDAFTTALAGRLALSHADDMKLAGMLQDEAFGSPSMNFRGGLMGAAINADSRSSPVRRIPLSNPLLDSWQS